MVVKDQNQFAPDAGDCIPGCCCCRINRWIGRRIHFSRISFSRQSQVAQLIYRAALPDGTIVSINLQTAGLSHFWSDGRTINRIEDAGMRTVYQLAMAYRGLAARPGIGARTMTEAKRVLGLFEPVQPLLEPTLY